MSQKVPVPATTLEQLAKNTISEEERQYDEGRSALARDIARSRTKATEAVKGRTGFVSVESTALTTLVAFGGVNDASDVAEKMLEKYNVW